MASLARLPSCTVERSDTAGDRCAACNRTAHALMLRITFSGRAYQVRVCRRLPCLSPPPPAPRRTIARISLSRP